MDVLASEDDREEN